MSNNLVIIYRIYILFLLIIYSWVNIDILHWKTFYQSIIFQISFYILWDIYNYKKKKSLSICTSAILLLNIAYWTILSSLIDSLTVDFYKLGRYIWHLDFFKYTIGFVPIIIAYNIEKYKNISKSYIYLILLLTSISFYYTFLESPEISLFLALPFLIEIDYKKLNYFNPYIIGFLAVLLSLQFTVGHISFYGYGILCNLLLVFTIIAQRTNVGINFYLLILLTGSVHIISRQYLNQGSLEFFSKDSSSILNSNRVSGYYILFIPIALKLINFNRFNRNTIKGFFLIFLISLILLLQYSRGATAAALISAFFLLLIFLFQNFQFKHILRYTFNFLVITVSITPILVFLLDRYQFLSVKDFDSFSAGRFELWKYFIQIYLNEFPLINKLFGIGIAQNDFFLNYLPLDTGVILKSFVTHGTGSYIHPHNTQLGILVYSGLMGFLLFNYIIIRFLFSNLRNLHNKRIFMNRYLDISIIYIFMIHGSFDFLLDINSIMIIIFFFSNRMRKNKNLYFHFYNNKFNLIQKTIFVLVPMIILLLTFRNYDIFMMNTYKAQYADIWQESSLCQVSKLPDSNHISTLSEFQRKEYEKLGHTLSGNYLYGFRKISQSQEGILILLSLYKVNPTDELLQSINNSYKLCSHFHYKSFICDLNGIPDFKISEELYAKSLEMFCKLR